MGPKRPTQADGDTPREKLSKDSAKSDLEPLFRGMHKMARLQAEQRAAAPRQDLAGGPVARSPGLNARAELGTRPGPSRGVQKRPSGAALNRHRPEDDQDRAKLNTGLTEENPVALVPEEKFSDFPWRRFSRPKAAAFIVLAICLIAVYLLRNGGGWGEITPRSPIEIQAPEIPKFHLDATDLPGWFKPLPEHSAGQLYAGGKISLPKDSRAEPLSHSSQDWFVPIEVEGRLVESASSSLILESDPERMEDSLGLDRETRRDIQRRLTIAGFDPGGVDGVFGRRTRSAISSWQQARGLPVSGFLQADHLAELLNETESAYGGIVKPDEQSQ